MSKRVSRFYTGNIVGHSMLGNRFYFIRKAEMLDGGVMRVIGQKVDVTESLQPYLLKKYRTDRKGNR